MAVGSALAAQVGWAIETTAGTRVAPNRFAEFIDESLQLRINRIERMGLRAGRRLSYGWSAGTQQVEGSITFDLSQNALGTIWRACLGSVSTTGSNPYTHTFTPGDLPSLTVQVGVPFTSGTVQPLDFVGCYVNQWSVSCSPNEFVRMGVDLVGMNSQTSQSLASASYSQGSFFTFAHGELTVGGTSLCVDDVTVTGNNGLRVTHKVCATNPGWPDIDEEGMRDYGGTFNIDWENLTNYNRFVNGTEAALSLSFTVSTSASLTITGNVRIDGDGPTIGGPEIVRQAVPFKFTSSSSDASAITVTYVNTDSTP